MSDLVRETERPRILLPSASSSSDRSNFLRGLGAMSGLVTLAACSGGSTGLPRLGSSGSLGLTRPWSSAQQLAATSGTSLSFAGPNGSHLTAAIEGSVLTVTGFNSSGTSLGSFTATANAPGAGKVTFAGKGFSTPFVATPLVTPTGPVSILGHTISSASPTLASISGPLITDGTATGSAVSNSSGVTLSTSVGASGIATQTYTHTFVGSGTGGGSGCRVCPQVGLGSISPQATTWQTSWFFIGLAVVGAIVGVIAMIVGSVLLGIIAAICAIVAAFWDICLQL